MKQNKPKFKNEDSVISSKNNIRLRKVYKSHFTDKKIEKQQDQQRNQPNTLSNISKNNSEKPYGKELRKRSMEVKRFFENLSDALKKEKAEHKTKSRDNSDEKLEANETYMNIVLLSLFSEVCLNRTMA